ncbi:MAG: acylphosphatase, partial [Candidatus Altiarchaeales archaeon]
MKRITVIAKGEVQRVGYRDEVQRIARKLGIKGYVENIKPYDVKIVAEGEEKKLEEFIKAIKIKRFPIEVESLDVKWERATDEFEYFEIKRGPPEEELGERLDAAAKYLFRSVELSERSVALGERSVEIGEESVKLGRRSVELSERSVALGERSVQLGERSVEIGEKMLEKQDKMLEMQKQTLEKQDQMLE